jgi:hypothetical protein
VEIDSLKTRLANTESELATVSNKLQTRIADEAAFLGYSSIAVVL